MKLGNFCFDVTIPRWRTDRIEIHDAPGMCAYYRGIRVANLQKPAALTYNVGMGELARGEPL